MKFGEGRCSALLGPPPSFWGGEAEPGPVGRAPSGMESILKSLEPGLGRDPHNCSAWSRRDLRLPETPLASCLQGLRRRLARTAVTPRRSRAPMLSSGMIPCHMRKRPQEDLLSLPADRPCRRPGSGSGGIRGPVAGRAGGRAVRMLRAAQTRRCAKCTRVQRETLQRGGAAGAHARLPGSRRSRSCSTAWGRAGGAQPPPGLGQLSQLQGRVPPNYICRL